MMYRNIKSIGVGDQSGYRAHEGNMTVDEYVSLSDKSRLAPLLQGRQAVLLLCMELAVQRPLELTLGYKINCV